MLNKQTVSVLKDLNNITNKVIMKYPVTTFVSDANDIVVNVDWSKIDSEGFEDFGLYEINKLISLVSIFDDYEVKKEQNKLIFNSKQDTAVLITSDINLLKHFDKPSTIVESLEKFPTVCEFTLTSHDLRNFIKVSSIFNDLEGFNIKAEDKNCILELVKVNRFDSSENSYKKEYLRCSEKNFEILLGMENISKLPLTDYQVKVFYNEEKDAYRVMFKTELYSILVARKAN